MIKEQTIHNLQKARTAHVRALNAVKLLVSGLHVDPSQFKLGQTETAFGKWFYEEAMIFATGNSRIHIEAIETTLLQLHDHFTKIYQIYFANQSGGIMGLLGKKNKPSDAEKELARRLYDEMIVFSDQLKQKLRVFETQLLSMSEEKFEELHYNPPLPNPVEAKEPETEDNGQYHFGARGR